MIISNRELAALILITAVLLIGVFKPAVRSSLHKVLAAFSIEIAVIFGGYLATLILASTFLADLGIWSWRQWPGLAIWIAFSGLPVVFSLTKAGSTKGLFKRKAQESIGLLAAVSFISEARSFALWIELLLPLATIFFWLGSTGRNRDEKARGCFSAAFVLLILIPIAHSITWLVANASVDTVVDQVTSFVVLITWSLVTLFFLFLASVFVVYQSTFMRFRRARVQPSVKIWKLKLAMIWGLQLDLEMVHRLNPHWDGKLLSAASFNEANERLDEFKYRQFKNSEDDKRTRLKLIHNAGVRGRDEAGRQLDRRGFDEVQDVLVRFSKDMERSYRTRGMYPITSDIEWNVIDPFNKIRVRPNYRINDDANEYWSWIITKSGFVFGVAGIEGGHEPWLWAGWKRPTSGPRSDERWMLQSLASDLVDWGSWVTSLE